MSRAKASLEDIIGQPVLGYRAPCFSIGADQAWAYVILTELGFRYDSSVYPIRHDLYGDPHGARAPHVIRNNGATSFFEFPIGTTRILGTNLPIGGGGYFRMLPLPIIRWGIRRVNRRDRTPFLFYIHPWELDPDLPRPPIAWHHRFRLFVGLCTAEARLAALLSEFPFAPIRDVLGLI